MRQLSLAQGWRKPGPGQIFRNLEIWNPEHQKMKALKSQIRSAQNVGKVWISRKTILLAPFGGVSGNFQWTGKMEKLC